MYLQWDAHYLEYDPGEYQHSYLVIYNFCILC